MDARSIVEQGLSIAGDICIYTNHNRTIEELDCKEYKGIYMSQMTPRENCSRIQPSYYRPG